MKDSGVAPALRGFQGARESGPTGLASLSPVTAHCRTARMISLTMFLYGVCPPVSGVPLLTGQLAVTSGISEVAEVLLVLWTSVLPLALASFQPTPGSEGSVFL